MTHALPRSLLVVSRSDGHFCCLRFRMSQRFAAYSVAERWSMNGVISLCEFCRLVCAIDDAIKEATRHGG